MKQSRPCQSELGWADDYPSRRQPAISRWVAPLQSPTPFHGLAACLPCIINLSRMAVKFFLSSPCLKKPKPNLPDAQSMQSNCIERATDTDTVCRPTDSAEEPFPQCRTRHSADTYTAGLSPCVSPTGSLRVGHCQSPLPELACHLVVPQHRIQVFLVRHALPNALRTFGDPILEKPDRRPAYSLGIISDLDVIRSRRRKAKCLVVVGDRAYEKPSGRCERDLGGERLRRLIDTTQCLFEGAVLNNLNLPYSIAAHQFDFQSGIERLTRFCLKHGTWQVPVGTTKQQRAVGDKALAPQ